MLLPKKATYQVLHHMTLIAAFHESRSLGSKFTALGKITKLPTVAPAIDRAVETKGAEGSCPPDFDGLVNPISTGEGINIFAPPLEFLDLPIALIGVNAHDAFYCLLWKSILDTLDTKVSKISMLILVENRSIYYEFSHLLAYEKFTLRFKNAYGRSPLTTFRFKYIFRIPCLFEPHLQ